MGKDSGREAYQKGKDVLILVLVDLGGKDLRLFAQEVLYEYVLILVLVDLGGKVMRYVMTQRDLKLLS